jgi:hypothetical protein
MAADTPPYEISAFVTTPTIELATRVLKLHVEPATKPRGEIRNIWIGRVQ